MNRLSREVQIDFFPAKLFKGFELLHQRFRFHGLTEQAVLELLKRYLMTVFHSQRLTEKGLQIKARVFELIKPVVEPQVRLFQGDDSGL